MDDDKNTLSGTSALASGTAPLTDPDCIRCLRKKLRATGVAVFFKKEFGWILDNFEGDKPGEAAEAEFQYMLKAGIPDTLLKQENGLILPDQEAIAAVLPQISGLFEGSCLIATPVRRGPSLGVRLAWRDSLDPFTTADLKTIECLGECPENCE